MHLSLKGCSKREIEGTHNCKDALSHHNGSADAHADGNCRVHAAERVDVLGQRPRRGRGVEGLHRGTTPGRVTIRVGKQVVVVVDDGDHDDVVDDGAEQRAVDLGEEHDSRRDLDYGGVSDITEIWHYTWIKFNLRYSPSFRSADRLTQLAMTL